MWTGEMGKTYRELPRSQYRRPRGRVQALRRGDRAVPPSPWNDVEHDAECWLPWRLFWRMAGADEAEVVAERIGKKFKLSRAQVREMADAYRNRSGPE